MNSYKKATLTDYKTKQEIIQKNKKRNRKSLGNKSFKLFLISRQEFLKPLPQVVMFTVYFTLSLTKPLQQVFTINKHPALFCHLA